MRSLLPLATLLALAACSAPPPATPSVPPPEASTIAVSADGFCSDIFVHFMAETRQNFSLAAEYYRSASAESDPLVRRDAYCAASSYLRWLLDNAPLYTGGAPDDRNFLRLANVYEYFAATEGAPRRSYLDSALALRARGLALYNATGATPDVWTRDLHEGLFFFANADAYPDASRREFEALRRAFAARPDSLDDWYLRRLATASGEFIDAPEARATFLEALAAPMEDQAYADYLEAIAQGIRAPAAVAPVASSVEPLLAAFSAGDYADCEPSADVRTLHRHSLALSRAHRGCRRRSR